MQETLSNTGLTNPDCGKTALELLTSPNGPEMVEPALGHNPFYHFGCSFFGNGTRTPWSVSTGARGMVGEVLVFCREGKLPRKTGAEAGKVAKGDAFLPSLLNSRELRVATFGGIPGSGKRAGGNTGGAVGCGANLNGKHETYHLGALSV